MNWPGLDGTLLVQDARGKVKQSLPYVPRGLRVLALEDAGGELGEQLPGGDVRVAASAQTAGEGVNLQRTGQQLPPLVPIQDPEMFLARWTL